MRIIYSDDDVETIISVGDNEYFDYHADVEDLMTWDLESMVYYGRV